GRPSPLRSATATALGALVAPSDISLDSRKAPLDLPSKSEISLLLLLAVARSRTPSWLVSARARDTGTPGIAYVMGLWNATVDPEELLRATVTLPGAAAVLLATSMSFKLSPLISFNAMPVAGALRLRDRASVKLPEPLFW